MKKIVLASLIALSSQLALAASTQDTINPEFAKIEEMVKANNMAGAYQALEKLAKSGNPQAMYNLAYLTQTGQGTAKNEKKAIQLYQDAANKGYPVAHYVLAKNYVTGTLGLPQDINKAKQHFEAASKLGFDDATVEYAVLLFSENKPESEKLALKKLEPLVKKGNYQAIHAQALYDISTGFKNKQEAPIQKGLNSIQDLAKKGYIPALMAVGNMFANGNIIPQNLPEAKKIFTALAKENVPQAKESLAMVDKMIADQAKAPAATAAVKNKSLLQKNTLN
ncbi:tetratricopeptide repeat protein [Acinetobacter johnsonii]|uniref:Sel1 repeat protein n=2 Tax=Acinetobacter TaxID=469 RepID=D0SB14_ACIJO|nr:tetratricopeptide repeat protein [Acinetobacter johnsonii]EEY96346.1 Sel1 repeat protein [Acinetobacter johnsonii SH046]MDV2487116.1 tetratricopeptide repeat protein [Acinetobacter johnsonii]